MKTLRPFLILLALLALSACRSVVSTNDPEIKSGDILFQDNFSDSNSGWDRITVVAGEKNYLNGVYRIYVNQSNADVLAKPGLNFSDARIEVDAAKIGGPDDNDFGVACRVQDSQTYYFFLISSDGFYGIGKNDEQGQHLIMMDALQPSEIIQQGQAVNHIRADCIGKTLTLYVNGERLAEVQDEQHSEGDVGLIAGTFATPGTDIHFDNFQVIQP